MLSALARWPNPKFYKQHIESFSMIVPMKKVYIVTQSKQALAALTALRDLGVLHLEHERVPESRDVEEMQHNIRIINNTLEILKAEDGSDQPAADLLDWQSKAQEILELEEIILKLHQQIFVRQSQIDQWAGWGNFEPEDIKFLAQKGIYIHLCEVGAKEFKDIPAENVLGVIEKRKATVRCAIISSQSLVPYSAIALPDMSLHQMRESQDQDQEQLQKAMEQLQQEAGYRKTFVRILAAMTAELNFQEALAGMGDEGSIAYIKGFCPAEQCVQLQVVAQQQHWVVMIQDPDADDMAPTLLKNPKWVEFIKPVFEFMSIIPGYREADISAFFLVFLSIFFGILVGDAGYGILFIVFSAVVHRMSKPKKPQALIFYLIYVMSSFAIVWGLLTGTFFGTKLFGSVIKPLCPWLTDNKNVQLLCFILGAVHLSIAHIWRAINRLGSITVLAEMGWLVIVWICFFFTRLLILNVPLPSYTNILLCVGPALVIFFNQPRKNILAGAGLGLGDLLLSVMGFFGDTVSYIRLFAVGLASVSVADAFNQMALSVGFDNALVGIGAIVILVIGHALNMVLACFGVLVHGIRLNLLEFSSHLGLEWVGKEYNPFRKDSLSTERS